MKRFYVLALLALMAPAIAVAGSVPEKAQEFVDTYSKQYQKLVYESGEAEWRSNTMIVEGDTTNAYSTREANEALAAFTGSKDNIEKAREFLKHQNP